jgi:uncharacterized protein DUF2851
MTEDVLQYIWKVQAIKKSNLLTVKGEVLQIIRQGTLNSDSGPDFSSASVTIEGVDWVGDIEIHLKTSYWQRHKHQQDLAYNKVILHVVWEHDSTVLREDGSEIPTLELKNLVSKDWLNKYENLRSSILITPCEPFFKEVDDIYKIDAFNKSLIERLQRKSQSVLTNVERLRGDWKQATILLLFEYFGFKKNNEAFKQLASITDAKIISRLGTIVEMEAYLLGMAGLLNESIQKNQYRTKLLSEFKWLQKKFNITTEPMSVTWWKFMRMRPANFPTIRLAQLAALLINRPHIFQSILEAPVKDAGKFFSVQQSEFWRTHYHFNKVAKSGIKGMGEQSSYLLSINVAAVLLVAYGNYTNNESYIEKAINFLEAQKPEDNVITRQWQTLGARLNNAAESQGAIELFNNYCKGRKCLQCNIGSQILSSK